MTLTNKRRDSDVTKLMMEDFKVELIGDGYDEFEVEFHGPKDSLYEGWVWKLHVELPEDYPYRPPSIEFINSILHPNISPYGKICVNVLKEDWSPMTDLVSVFNVLLPQLLLDPNASDPLNPDAAYLLMEDEENYKERVKEHCARYAIKETANSAAEDATQDEEGSDASGPSDAETGESEKVNDEVDEAAS